jgi:predicted enzyme related to lactoylglutathione lyase
LAEHANFYWNELLTDDVESQYFYRAVLGWEAEAMPMPSGASYTVFKANGKPVGGMMDKAHAQLGANVPNHWMSYVHVSDVDAAVQKVSASGGKVLQPCFEVPDVGRIAVVQDPGGAVIGIMTAKQ